MGDCLVFMAGFGVGGFVVCATALVYLRWFLQEEEGGQHGVH